MSQRIAGPGLPLPAPQSLYPTNMVPQSAPYTPGQNTITLAPGQSILIPAGEWMIDLGKYSILEFQDPVNYPNITTTVGVWRPIRTQRGTIQMRSDGVNYRLSNLTGCAVAAVVADGGHGYVQATTTVTPSTGTSTWYPIIGGQIDSLTCSIVGANYTLAPIVYIPAPPGPGIQAEAVATVSGGAITGFTVTNRGAGYPTAPTVTILPNPFDQNITSTTAITQAIASAHLTGTTSITGVLCTNPGAPVASTMTLTVAGAGQSGSVTPLFLTTISALTVSGAGSGSISGAAITTYGGAPATDQWGTINSFIPRQAQIGITVTTGQLVPGSATIVDGGMFLGTANPMVLTYGGNVGVGNAPTVTLTQGSANDQVIIQPI